MEQSLALYAEPSDAERPVLCCDEMPYQLLDEVQAALPAAPGQVRREDYAYARQGVCNLWLACEPLTGWRQVTVTETRKNPDFAQAMQTLVQTHYPTAKERRVVLDNLSTPTPAALYQTFAPPEARALTKKLSFHYTPKHGSGLHMAECEFSVRSRQCLQQRLPSQDRVQEVVHHGASLRTAKQLTVHWQFTTEKARDKFKRFYLH
jgi:hypothetical protein